MVLLGLRTIIYPTRDIAVSRAWFAALLEQQPHIDQQHYVGFDVGGYELGLIADPDGSFASTGPVTYWGVPDVDAAVTALLAVGGELYAPVTDVGDGVRTAAVIEPGGHVFGVIENPYFAVRPVRPPGDAPGR